MTKLCQISATISQISFMAKDNELKFKILVHNLGDIHSDNQISVLIKI